MARKNPRNISVLPGIPNATSGKMRLELQRVALTRVVGAALDSVKPSIEAKAITFSSNFAPELGLVRGDPSRLQQVVWNLLSNAVKFTDRGGRIELELRRADGMLELQVRDTGRGIAPNFLPHVFDRFRQADGRITRSFGGLGLGLSISRDIVALHGGEIHVESAGEGRGATFVVKLPVSAEASEPESRPSAARQNRQLFAQPAQLRGLKVLVVDDDDDSRQLVIRILEECGAQVANASNVRDALSAITVDPPDLLVSDIGMPIEDGFDLIRQVRALPPSSGGRVPAVALTAYTRAQDRKQLLTAGYLAHVPKPVDPAELVSVVATYARSPD